MIGMKGKTSALHSVYVIDGQRRQFTPAELLDTCLTEGTDLPPRDRDTETIVDETLDLSPSSLRFDGRHIQQYLARTVAAAGRVRPCPLAFAGRFTRSRIAKALLDTIWMRGHFRLGDLQLQARWKWNDKALGNMASFYASVEEAVEYIDALGVSLNAYSFSETDGDCQVAFKVGASGKGAGAEDNPDDETYIDLGGDAPFGTEHPVLGRKKAHGDTLVPDKDSWIIYVPFESCAYRLGGSVLEESLGAAGNTFPEIGDADYFIDCYEVVRELVEDGIVTAGATVGDGGLLTALKLMCTDGVGATVDVSCIMSASHEDKSIRVLFGEVPGALIQIKDIDYDYIDAEFLLQDVAYFPIGHPDPKSGSVKVKAGGDSGIASILQSLLSSQASEGED